MKEITINISTAFGKYPGGRKRRDFKFSGEEFRQRFLDENFQRYDRLNIELDGTLGYQWDFLDEAFGSLAREYGKELFWKKINLISRNAHTTEKIQHIVDQITD